MSLYTVFKNHLHNTLGITKEEIREMVEASVHKIVERRVDVLLEHKINLDRLVDETIRRKITKHNWYWNESEDTLDDYIKKEVVDQLLNGVKLKVEVVGRKADATPKYRKIKLKVNKR